MQLINVGTQNVQAYNAFLLGLHEFRKGTRQSFEQAVVHFQQAARLDPGFGRAFWQLHRCYGFLVEIIRLPREELTPKAQEALNSAKALGFVPPYPWVRTLAHLLITFFLHQEEA